MVSESTQHKRYRALSSVGEALLPRTEQMHREGMTWRQIASQLKVSYTCLYVWRRIRENES